MNNHTPWTVRTVSGCAGGLERLTVVNLRVTCNADTVEEVRLIAEAAPDLLAALELAYQELETAHRFKVGLINPEALGDARDAIAKARGE